MFESKTGMKCMNHRVLSIYRNRLAVAWIVEFLFAIKDARSAI
jgi:hypothetical protein